MRLNKYAISLVAATTLISVSVAAQEPVSTVPRKLAMPQPGIFDSTKDATGVHEIFVDVNHGDVKIVSSPAAHQMRLNIRSTRKERDGAMDAWVEQFSVAGGVAHVTVRLPKDNHGRSGSITLYLPSEATLRAHLGIGDLNISGIKGDKTVDVGIGDLTISAPGADEYGQVRANTRIGDVTDELNHAKPSGWLGKTENVKGVGKYTLQAHVGIGDLKIEKQNETPE